MESHAAILSQNMENEQGIKRHGFAGSTLLIGKEPDDRGLRVRGHSIGDRYLFPFPFCEMLSE